jgi:hypothetical protein
LLVDYYHIKSELDKFTNLNKELVRINNILKENLLILENDKTSMNTTFMTNNEVSIKLNEELYFLNKQLSQQIGENEILIHDNEFLKSKLKLCENDLTQLYSKQSKISSRVEEIYTFRNDDNKKNCNHESFIKLEEENIKLNDSLIQSNKKIRELIQTIEKKKLEHHNKLHEMQKKYHKLIEDNKEITNRIQSENNFRIEALKIKLREKIQLLIQHQITK